MANHDTLSTTNKQSTSRLMEISLLYLFVPNSFCQRNGTFHKERFLNSWNLCSFCVIIKEQKTDVDNMINYCMDEDPQFHHTLAE